MKKTTLLKTMLLLCALVVGSNSLWAAVGDVLAEFLIQQELAMPLVKLKLIVIVLVGFYLVLVLDYGEVIVVRRETSNQLKQIYLLSRV